jgi:hypothetical protein
MLVIIKSILSFSSLAMIGVYFWVNSRNKNYARNLLYKRCGIECYKCSSTINDVDINILKNQDNLSLCLSCKRDFSLKRFFGKLNVFRYYFDKWMLSKKSEYITLGVLTSSLFIVIFSLFSFKEWSSEISITNSSIIILYWMSQIYRIFISKVK